MTTPTTRNAWYADGLAFACTRCGNCCSGAPGYVWVNEAECRQIAKTLGVPPADFLKHHTRVVGARRSLLEHDDGDCVFLERHADGTTGCRIHDARPTQCRTWPFWKSNLWSARAWEQTATDCPGIDQGATHPLPVIQAALQDNGDLPL